MAEGRQTRSETGVRPPSEFEAHEMRITQGGKIHAWVQFALKFFEVRKVLTLFNVHNSLWGLRRTRRKRWYYIRSP